MVQLIVPPSVVFTLPMLTGVAKLPLALLSSAVKVLAIKYAPVRV